MIEYTNFNDFESDDEPLRFVAEEQSWDKATLKELKDKYNVIFMTKGSGVSPVMIINVGSEENPHFLLAIGGEDDGCISFERYLGSIQNTFSIFWAKYLIADIEAALKICDKKMK